MMLAMRALHRLLLPLLLLLLLLLLRPSTPRAANCIRNDVVTDYHIASPADGDVVGRVSTASSSFTCNGSTACEALRDSGFVCASTSGGGEHPGCSAKGVHHVAVEFTSPEPHQTLTLQLCSDATGCVCWDSVRVRCCSSGDGSNRRDDLRAAEEVLQEDEREGRGLWQPRMWPFSGGGQTDDASAPCSIYIGVTSSAFDYARRRAVRGTWMGLAVRARGGGAAAGGGVGRVCVHFVIGAVEARGDVSAAVGSDGVAVEDPEAVGVAEAVAVSELLRREQAVFGDLLLGDRVPVPDRDDRLMDKSLAYMKLVVQGQRQRQRQGEGKEEGKEEGQCVLVVDDRVHIDVHRLRRLLLTPESEGGVASRNFYGTAAPEDKNKDQKALTSGIILSLDLAAYLVSSSEVTARRTESPESASIAAWLLSRTGTSAGGPVHGTHLPCFHNFDPQSRDTPSPDRDRDRGRDRGRDSGTESDCCHPSCAASAPPPTVLTADVAAEDMGDLHRAALRRWGRDQNTLLRKLLLRRLEMQGEARRHGNGSTLHAATAPACSSLATSSTARVHIWPRLKVTRPYEATSDGGQRGNTVGWHLSLGEASPLDIDTAIVLDYELASRVAEEEGEGEPGNKGRDPRRMGAIVHDGIVQSVQLCLSFLQSGGEHGAYSDEICMRANNFSLEAPPSGTHVLRLRLVADEVPLVDDDMGDLQQCVLHSWDAAVGSVQHGWRVPGTRYVERAPAAGPPKQGAVLVLDEVHLLVDSISTPTIGAPTATATSTPPQPHADTLDNFFEAVIFAGGSTEAGSGQQRVAAEVTGGSVLMPIADRSALPTDDFPGSTGTDGGLFDAVVAHNNLAMRSQSEGVFIGDKDSVCPSQSQPASPSPALFAYSSTAAAATSGEPTPSAASRCLRVGFYFKELSMHGQHHRIELMLDKAMLLHRAGGGVCVEAELFTGDVGCYEKWVRWNQAGARSTGGSTSQCVRLLGRLAVQQQLTVRFLSILSLASADGINDMANGGGIEEVSEAIRSVILREEPEVPERTELIQLLYTMQSYDAVVLANTFGDVQSELVLAAATALRRNHWVVADPGGGHAGAPTHPSETAPPLPHSPIVLVDLPNMPLPVPWHCHVHAIMAPSYYVGSAESTLALNKPVVVLPPASLGQEFLHFMEHEVCAGVDVGSVESIGPVAARAKLNLLFVGRLDSEKSVGLLLSTVARLARLDGKAADPYVEHLHQPITAGGAHGLPVLHLHVVGTGALDGHLKLFARQLGLLANESSQGEGDFVTFHGGMSQHEIASLLFLGALPPAKGDSASRGGAVHVDALVNLRAEGETYGMVHLEAGAAGIPVVALHRRANVESIAAATTATDVPRTTQPSHPRRLKNLLIRNVTSTADLASALGYFYHRNVHLPAQHMSKRGREDAAPHARGLSNSDAGLLGRLHGRWRKERLLAACDALKAADGVGVVGARARARHVQHLKASIASLVDHFSS